MAGSMDTTSSQFPFRHAPKATRSASKTAAAFWMKKVYLETKREWKSANYFVRLQVRGERRKVRLESTVKEMAAREAASLYAKVQSSGWHTLDQAKPDSSVPEIPEGEAPAPITLETWIHFAEGKLNVRPQTIKVYSDSLRTIVSELLGLDDTPKLKKKAIVLASNVELLTKANVQKWIDSRVGKAREMDPVQARRAQNTVRTLVGNAKGLFASELIEAEDSPHISLQPLPFHEVKLPPKLVARYSSRFDANLLLEQARLELSLPPQSHLDEEWVLRFELWKILYMALVAGLRYSEIDQLKTEAVSVRLRKISIRLHEGFQPKNLASEGEVPISEEAKEVISVMLKHSENGWFLKANTSRRFKNYRAGLSHDRLVTWLRAYKEEGRYPFGDVSKPIHELRKEAGTLVNKNHGLAEAQNFLRHSSIATTASYYVGSKGDVTTGLS